MVNLVERLITSSVYVTYILLIIILQHFNKANINVNKGRINSMSSKIGGDKSATKLEMREENSNSNSCNVTGVTVDCSGLSLEIINSSWFSNTTEIILLNNNNLTILLNYTFSNCLGLKHLDLSHNKINHIDIRAFDGLTNLQNLSLSNNRILLTTPSKLKEIFSPLKNLTELNIMYNTRGHFDIISYTLLEPLTQLRKLSLEYTSDPVFFGAEFSKLEKLKVLVIAGTARIFNDTSFKNLGSLEDLTITTMEMLTNISQNVFEPLQNLTNLTINNIYLPVQHILSLLWPFTNRTMTHITLDTISTRLNVPISIKDVYITETDTLYLRNICVNHLALRYCLISYVTIGAFRPSEKWHNCLSSLDLSYNPILGNMMSFLALFSLRSLNSFTANEFLRTCNPFSKFPYASEIATMHRDRRDVKSINNIDTFYYHQSKEYLAKNITIIFKVPVNLTFIAIQSSLSSKSLPTNIIFLNGHNVKYIDFSDNDMFYSFQGKMQGLTSLKTIILSRHSMSDLAFDFFDTFPVLENLALAKCKLEQTFFSIYSKRVFEKLLVLKQLDLSLNYLNMLSSGTFSYNSKLQLIDLSLNQFREIPFNLKYTPELLELNISNNAVTSLDTESMKKIDKLLIKNGKFKISLSGNILSCGCSDLYFLQWIKETKVTLDQDANYTCINKDGVMSYTADYNDLEILWRECWGQFYFYVAIIVMCLYAACVVTIFIFLKNRRFLVSYLLQILGQFRFHTVLDYDIGVYIGYADRDYQFPCNELRQYIEKVLKLTTFINDRDLLPSLDKACGIVDAINKSWRIVLVCSERFLSDDWSMFTMRSSIYAQSPANSSKIIVMVHQSCVHKLPTELLSAVNDENIAVMSKWELTYGTKEMLRTRLTAR